MSAKPRSDVAHPVGVKVAARFTGVATAQSCIQPACSSRRQVVAFLRPRSLVAATGLSLTALGAVERIQSLHPPIAGGDVGILHVSSRAYSVDEIDRHDGLRALCSCLGSLTGLNCRMRVEAQRHIESRGEVRAVLQFGQLTLRRLDECLPAQVNRLGALLLWWPKELEEEEAVLLENRLRCQLVRFDVEALRSGFQQNLMVRFLALPTQQKHGALVPEVWEHVISQVSFRLEEALLHRVEQDVPEGHRGTEHGCHPSRSSKSLPLLAWQRLVRVTPDHQQWVEEINDQVPPVLKPDRHEEGREEGSESPEVPGVEVRKADHQRQRGRRVQRKACDELAHIRGQRCVANLRRRASAGSHGSNKGDGGDEVDEVLPEEGVSRRVRQGQNHAELRPKSSSLLRRSLGRLGGPGGDRRILLLLVRQLQAPAGDHCVRQREAHGHEAEAELAGGDGTLHERHSDAEQYDADEEPNTAHRVSQG
mmetsp:Transcript_56844/g.122942  ORF Transcript_56844/g.122942 Transcript_56844/m.122942 type:complete len:479 (+) Transcript_56844:136-1572(+)